MRLMLLATCSSVIAFLCFFFGDDLWILDNKRSNINVIIKVAALHIVYVGVYLSRL